MWKTHWLPSRSTNANIQTFLFCNLLISIVSFKGSRRARPKRGDTVTWLISAPLMNRLVVAKPVMAAPPVYSLPCILHSSVRRARFPLRRQPFPYPSAFGHRCYNTLRPLGIGINRIHFPSIALLIPPNALYIYLGWGSPSGPPACLSTLRQTLLLFCSLILIWRFCPHSRQTLSELPSPSSA